MMTLAGQMKSILKTKGRWGRRLKGVWGWGAIAIATFSCKLINVNLKLPSAGQTSLSTLTEIYNEPLSYCEPPIQAGHQRLIFMAFLDSVPIRALTDLYY